MKDEGGGPRRGRRRWIATGMLLAAVGGLAWFASRPQPTGPAEGTHLPSPSGRGAGGEGTGSSLRIATFNIHGGTGEDGRRDVSRVAECLDGFDFVALQEVHGPRLWEGDDQAALLGRRLGMAWLFAPATRNWQHLDFGNGLLTRLPVESWQRVPLSADNGRGYRNLVLADVRHGGRTIHILLTHVNLGDDVRHQQLGEVIDRYLALPEPAVLLGDFNSGSGDPEIRSLLAVPGVIDAVGQALGPRNRPRVDWIFVRGLKILDAGIRDNRASDHPVVWAEVD